MEQLLSLPLAERIGVVKALRESIHQEMGTAPALSDGELPDLVERRA